MAARKKTPTVGTQLEFDEKMKSLSATTAKISKAKPRKKAPTKKTTRRTKVIEVKDAPKYKQENQPTKTPAFNSYIVSEEDYELHTLYKSYYKSKNDPLKIAGFHAGSIMFRAMGDYERRCNVYLATVKGTVKKEIKEAIFNDLDTLKKKILEM